MSPLFMYRYSSIDLLLFPCNYMTTYSQKDVLHLRPQLLWIHYESLRNVLITGIYLVHRHIKQTQGYIVN